MALNNLLEGVSEAVSTTLNHLRYSLYTALVAVPLVFAPGCDNTVGQLDPNPPEYSLADAILTCEAPDNEDYLVKTDCEDTGEGVAVCYEAREDLALSCTLESIADSKLLENITDFTVSSPDFDSDVIVDHEAYTATIIFNFGDVNAAESTNGNIIVNDYIPTLEFNITTPIGDTGVTAVFNPIYVNNEALTSSETNAEVIGIVNAPLEINLLDTYGINDRENDLDCSTVDTNPADGPNACNPLECIITGESPQGLEMDGCVLGGSVAEEGSYNLTIEVRDPQGAYIEGILDLDIVNLPTISAVVKDFDQSSQTLTNHGSLFDTNGVVRTAHVSAYCANGNDTFIDTFSTDNTGFTSFQIETSTLPITCDFVGDDDQEPGNPWYYSPIRQRVEVTSEGANLQFFLPRTVDFDQNAQDYTGSSDRMHNLFNNQRRLALTQEYIDVASFTADANGLPTDGEIINFGDGGKIYTQDNSGNPVIGNTYNIYVFQEYMLVMEELFNPPGYVDKLFEDDAAGNFNYHVFAGYDAEANIADVNRTPGPDNSLISGTADLDALYASSGLTMSAAFLVAAGGLEGALEDPSEGFVEIGSNDLSLGTQYPLLVPYSNQILMQFLPSTGAGLYDICIADFEGVVPCDDLVTGDTHTD